MRNRNHIGRDEKLLDWALELIQPCLLLAPQDFLKKTLETARRRGVDRAVQQHDSGPVFDYLLELFQYQGISDAAAHAFIEKHGSGSWHSIEDSLKAGADCPQLASYWHFDRCGYAKSAHSCLHSELLGRCPLPLLPLRKGVLNRLAYSLYLFVRDICDGDLVGWIDSRLQDADCAGAVEQRSAALRQALLDPMRHIHGVSDKVLALGLANLLLGGDSRRELWRIAGAGMIVVDTLMHNFFHRTGMLERVGAEHPYGDGCYLQGGCLGLLESLSGRIDARPFGPGYPAYFPRFVQHAIWLFCAQGGQDICNGNQIDDRAKCLNCHCPNFPICGRVPLHR